MQAYPFTITPSHEALVQHIASRLKHQLDLSIDNDDLVAWGYQGLLEAVLRFESDRGAKFATFAYYRVRGAMLDGVRKQGFLGRRAYAREKAARAAGDLAEAICEPFPQARADRSAAVQRILGGVVASYTLAIAGNAARCQGSPEALTEQAELWRAVRGCLADLSPRERTLIQALYFDNLTMEEAGARVGVSKSWASRTVTRALGRIREALDPPAV